MPTFWMPAQNAVFIHVPKTGGTSISRCLKDLRHKWTEEDRAKWDCVLRDSLSRRCYEPGHPRAVNMRDFFGEKAWRKMFSFAFVRDPIEHTLSGYRFAKTTISLDQWLDAIESDPLEHQAYSQWPYLLDEKGHLIIKHLANFSRLQEAFNAICIKLRIKPRQLPHTLQTGKSVATMAHQNRIRDLFYLDYNHFNQTLRQ